MSTFDGSENKFGNSPCSNNQADIPPVHSIVNLIVTRANDPLLKTQLIKGKKFSIYQSLLPKVKRTKKITRNTVSRVSSQVSMRSVGS